MITSRKLSRRGLFRLFVPITFSAIRELLPADRLPERRFEIGDLVRTERICDDHTSENYLGVDWECGFVVGYVWQFDQWRLEHLQQGWTYWVRFFKTNNEIFGDREWTDFVHESEMAIGEK